MKISSQIKSWPVLIVLAAANVLLLQISAWAAAPLANTQAPGFYRMILGEFEVTAINDGSIALDAEKLLAEPAEATAAALKKSFESNPVETSDNAFLVNTGAKLLLIDTGGGALLGPTLGHLLVNLRAAGYLPDQVDDIFLTHMHPDHVGGLVANGRRAFPNATVHADVRDADYWLSPTNRNKALPGNKGYFDGAVASLQPYIDADRFQTFGSDQELVPGLRSVAAHGHTPGHTAYLVESHARKLMLIGDLIHVAAVQLQEPGVTIAFDSDPPAAAATRKAIFARLGSEGVLIGAPHLQFPGLGHLQASGSSWHWTPANYSTQLHAAVNAGPLIEARPTP